MEIRLYFGLLTYSVIRFGVHSAMIKERRWLRWLGHAARRSDNSMVKQLLSLRGYPGHVQPAGRPCGTWINYEGYEGCAGHGTANGLPQHRMELAERSHGQTYLGRNC